MKDHRIFLTVLCILLFLQYSVTAQTGAAFDPLKDDITEKLPPLSVLLDSAMENNPTLKVNTLEVSVTKGNLRTAKAQWTQNFGVQANYGYGTFDYIYNNTLGGTTPSTYTFNQSLNQYGVGAFLRIPVSDMVNRRNLINVAKVQVQQAQASEEAQRRVVREEVIRQYNDLVVKQRLLRIKSKYLETSRINMQMADKSFTNGTLTVDEYSRITQIGAQTEADFETARMDFQTAYMILEEMVGMKFNLYNESR